MTKYFVSSAEIEAMQLAITTSTLAIAATTGPPWTWRKQWRQAHQHNPTPRHDAARGRRHVRHLTGPTHQPARARHAK